jgi:predicted AAA+ superfamily ATPase
VLNLPCISKRNRYGKIVHFKVERMEEYAQKKATFFDEIQVAPKAIMSLRYFYEEMPELHLIAAGSLLEFTIHG